MYLFQALVREAWPYAFATVLAYLTIRGRTKTGPVSTFFQLFGVAPLLVLLYLRFVLVRIDIPEHLLHTKYGVKEQFLSEDTISDLLRLTRANTLPSNNRDTQFYTREVEHEHIGEATPLTAKGDCSHHMLLVPNSKNDSCVLPGRVDIARHFLLTGGLAGRKEPVETGVSRLLSFGRYMFNVSDYPEASVLFDSPKFLQAAREICPADKQYLDPVQFNFIVQVPGQSVVSRTC